eukprot:3772741-Amphidinium_carterae.1
MASSYKFPDAFLGYMFLKGYDLSRAQGTDVICSAGSTGVTALEQVLRTSEAESEYIKRSATVLGCCCPLRLVVHVVHVWVELVHQYRSCVALVIHAMLFHHSWVKCGRVM